MLQWILVWILSALALLVTSRLVKGFEITGFKGALWAAMVVGLLNVLIRPLLFILTLPVNIITLGLFTFVLNAAVLRMSAGLLRDFKIDGWLPAILGAVVLAVVNMIFQGLFGPY